MQDWDFGFTAVDEEELDAVQSASNTTQQLEETLRLERIAYRQLEDSLSIERDKVNKLYNGILPLLKNLKANPEKNYLYWPGEERIEKIQNFENHLRDIKES